MIDILWTFKILWKEYQKINYPQLENFFFEPANEMYGHYFRPRCTSVRMWEKIQYDKCTWNHGSSKPWWAYTGHRTCERIVEQNFLLRSNIWAPKWPRKRIYGHYVPQFFRMFGDSVYAYHDFATRKNDD